MAIKQYTPEQFLEEYKQIPKEEQQLFLDAVAYWEKLNLGKKVTVPLDKQSENGGASYTGTPPILSMVIKTGSGGRVPVDKVAKKYTYLQYDHMVGPVHEFPRPKAPALGCL